MNSRFTVVETSLNRVEFRWKWLRLVERTVVLLAVVCALVLLLGAAMVWGWLTSKSAAVVCFWGLAGLAALSWAIILIAVAAGAPARHWLAAALERVDPRLLDRLNTLLFLESKH